MDLVLEFDTHDDDEGTPLIGTNNQNATTSSRYVRAIHISKNHF